MWLATGESHQKSADNTSLTNSQANLLAYTVTSSQHCTSYNGNSIYAYHRQTFTDNVDARTHFWHFHGTIFSDYGCRGSKNVRTRDEMSSTQYSQYVSFKAGVVVPRIHFRAAEYTSWKFLKSQRKKILMFLRAL